MERRGSGHTGVDMKDGRLRDNAVAQPAEASEVRRRFERRRTGQDRVQEAVPEDPDVVGTRAQGAERTRG